MNDPPPLLVLPACGSDALQPQKEEEGEIVGRGVKKEDLVCKLIADLVNHKHKHFPITVEQCLLCCLLCGITG